MRLREIRKQKRMKLKDLALLLHVSTQTISNWEQGHTEPDMYTLKKLSDIFDVSIDYLIGGNSGDNFFTLLRQRIAKMPSEELKIKILNYIDDLNHQEMEKAKEKRDE